MHKLGNTDKALVRRLLAGDEVAFQEFFSENFPRLYRFALSRPEIDICLAGPDDPEQMKQALDAFDRGPMDEQELAWMRRVGDHVYGRSPVASLSE